jgi:hypothetical protein
MEDLSKLRNDSEQNMNNIMNSESKYVSRKGSIFNPVSTDNQLSYGCNYKPDPIPRLENVYTYKDSIDIRPRKYNSFSEIKGGEIEYHPTRRTVLDNFRSPNFQNAAFIQSKIYKDPMGSYKPEYNRVQTKNKIDVDQLNWMKDTCEWREQLIASQMNRDNQTRYEPKWNL